MPEVGPDQVVYVTVHSPVYAEVTWFGRKSSEDATGSESNKRFVKIEDAIAHARKAQEKLEKKGLKVEVVLASRRGQEPLEDAEERWQSKRPKKDPVPRSMFHNDLKEEDDELVPNHPIIDEWVESLSPEHPLKR